MVGIWIETLRAHILLITRLKYRENLHKLCVERVIKVEVVKTDGMPRPHYLTHAEVSDLGEQSGYQLKGVTVFSSEDVSIGDRHDHVNVAHTAFACWNAAHVIAKEKAVHLRACGRVVIEPVKEMKPDVPVNLEAIVQVERRINDVCHGSFTATFSDSTTDQVFSKLSTQFVCRMVG